MVVGKGRPACINASKEKQKNYGERNKTFYCIDSIIELTVKIFELVERFNVQNPRAPAFFITLGMRTGTRWPSGINNTTSPPSTESSNEPDLLEGEKVVI